MKNMLVINAGNPNNVKFGITRINDRKILDIILIDLYISQH